MNLSTLSQIEEKSSSLLRDLRSNSINTRGEETVGASALRSLARGIGNTVTLGTSFGDAQYSTITGRGQSLRNTSLHTTLTLDTSKSANIKPGLPSIADLLDAACRARDSSLHNCTNHVGPIERIEDAPVRVGAALLAKSGKVHVGCTVDVFGSGLLPKESGIVNGGSLSAETVALIKAVSDGDTVFEALVIACDSDDVHVFPTTSSSKALASYGDFDVYASRSDRILIKRKISELVGSESNDKTMSKVESAESSILSSVDTISLSETHDVIFSGIPVLNWTVAHVLEWLDKSLGLPQYQHSFRECSVDGFLLLSLTSSDLRHLLRIEHPLHRRKTEQGIQRLLERRDREKNTTINLSSSSSSISKDSSTEKPLAKMSLTENNKPEVSAKTVQFTDSKQNTPITYISKSNAEENKKEVDAKKKEPIIQRTVPQKHVSALQKQVSVPQQSIISNKTPVEKSPKASNISPIIEDERSNNLQTKSTKSAGSSSDSIPISPLNSEKTATVKTHNDVTINQMDAVPIIETAANLHDDTRRLLHPQQVLRLFHVFLDASVSTSNDDFRTTGPLQPMNPDDSFKLLGSQTQFKGGSLDSSFVMNAMSHHGEVSMLSSCKNSQAVMSGEVIKREVSSTRLNIKMLTSASRRLGYFGTVVEAECSRLISARGNTTNENNNNHNSAKISFSDFADFVAGVFQHGSMAHSTACAAANRASAIAAAQVQLSQLAQVQAAQANALRVSLGLPASSTIHSSEKIDNVNSSIWKPIPVVDSRGNVVFINPVLTNRSTADVGVVTLPNLSGSSLLGIPTDIMNASFTNMNSSSFVSPPGTYFPANVRDGCVLPVSIHMVDDWLGAPGTDPWYTSGLDYDTYAVRVLRKQSSIFEEIIDVVQSSVPILSHSSVKQDDPILSSPSSPERKNVPISSNRPASVSSIHSQDSRHPADFAPDEIKIQLHGASNDESSASLTTPAKVALDESQNRVLNITTSRLKLSDTREIKSGEILSIGTSVIARKGGEKKAYPANISGLRKKRDGYVTYSVDFINGGEESDILTKYIRVIIKNDEVTTTNASSDSKVDNLPVPSSSSTSKPAPKFDIGDRVRIRFGDRKIARITNVRTDKVGEFMYDMMNSIGGVQVSSVPERDIEKEEILTGGITPTPISDKGIVKNDVALSSSEGKTQEGKIESESKL
jgi:cytidine deaminase